MTSTVSSSSEYFSLEVYDRGAQLTVDYSPDNVVFTDNNNQRKLAPPCGEQCFSLKHGSYSMNTPTTLNGIYAHPAELTSTDIGIIQSCSDPSTTTLLTYTPVLIAAPCQQQAHISTPLLYTTVVCPENINSFNVTFTNGTLQTISLLTSSECASQQRNLSLNVTNAFNTGEFFLTDAETIIVNGIAQEGDIIHVHIGDFLVHAHSSALDGPFTLPISLRSFLQQKSEQEVTLHVTAINKNTYSQETVDIIYTDDLNGYLKILIE